MLRLIGNLVAADELSQDSFLRVFQNRVATSAVRSNSLARSLGNGDALPVRGSTPAVTTVHCL